MGTLYKSIWLYKFITEPKVKAACFIYEYRDSECRVCNSELGIQGSGFVIHDSELRIQIQE